MIGLVIGLGGDLLAQGTAQTIRGKVLDESGDPLPMASVLVVGTKVGVTTNTKGDFTIKLPAGKNQLLIRFVSYKSQTVTAKDGMVIKLQPEATTLDNIVVTGMVATDKRLFTGASDKLKADKVKMAGMADISRGLEGKSAGVSVQNLSGTFGTAPKIRVRGATSIMGSSKPLWVVDGVIQEDVVDVGADDLSSGDATTLLSSAIAGLNADDIESFQILKDGSVSTLTLWDPADAGYAMASLATKILNGEKIEDGVNLGVKGYESMHFSQGSTKVLEGNGWIQITKDNVDSLGF